MNSLKFNDHNCMTHARGWMSGLSWKRGTAVEVKIEWLAGQQLVFVLTSSLCNVIVQLNSMSPVLDTAQCSDQEWRKCSGDRMLDESTERMEDLAWRKFPVSCKR